MSKWKCSEENKMFNKFFDIVNLVIIVTITMMTIKFWTDLPDIIPTHYGINGVANSYGSKNTLFIIIPFMIGMYLLVKFISNRPNICNYIVNITPLNREEQYNLVAKFLRIFCFEIIILFTYIQSSLIYSSVTNKGNMSLILIPLIIAILIGSIIIYSKKSKKIG